jgi:hypothetical protein
MLVLLKLVADFSRRCALSAIRLAFLLTHPHRPTDQGSRGSKQIGLLGTETPFLAALLVV